tara:strand:+ start:313 stop:624 length:312 start_codon:yes stop_codon:yes gene_type:complete
VRDHSGAQIRGFCNSPYREFFKPVFQQYCPRDSDYLSAALIMINYAWQNYDHLSISEEPMSNRVMTIAQIFPNVHAELRHARICDLVTNRHIDEVPEPGCFMK